jgi:hypothetical protein
MNSRSNFALVHVERPADGGLVLDLVGPLRLTDSEGLDLTPRSRKAQGLLALIGTSPGLRRSRAWLQDKLWSDRGQEQGAGSLRQCLTEIRSSLGRHVVCLMTEAGWVALDPEKVRVRAELPDSDRSDDTEFLEGLDIRDREFEHWIRDQRLHYLQNVRGGPAACRRLKIGLVAECRGADASAAVSGLALDLVAHSLLRFTEISVVDVRTQAGIDLVQPGTSPDGPDTLLHAVASVFAERVRVTLKLFRPGDGLLLWTDTATFGLGEFYRAESTTIEAFVDRAARSVLAQIGPPQGPASDAVVTRPQSRATGRTWCRAASNPTRYAGPSPAR